MPENQADHSLFLKVMNWYGTLITHISCSSAKSVMRGQLSSSMILRFSVAHTPRDNDRMPSSVSNSQCERL